MIEEKEIVVSLVEYEHLVEERKELYMIMDAIFDNCELSENGKCLKFYNIEQIMQIMQPRRYRFVLDDKRKERVGEFIEC